MKEYAFMSIGFLIGLLVTMFLNIMIKRYKQKRKETEYSKFR